MRLTDSRVGLPRACDAAGAIAAWACPALEYVSRNPLEAGLPSHKWSFVKSILA
jgi:hypothetical protein